MNTLNTFSAKTALVTGANSGLGFESAVQLADAGYGRVILACRTLEKAEAAREKLVERVGRDPFAVLEVDVSSIGSAEAAAAELIRQGQSIDSLLLNAGMVSGDQMNLTDDGYEVAFASSVIGHHVLTLRLLQAGLLPQGARVVLSGSEAANNDLPAMMDMKLYDFSTGEPHEFGESITESMINFARGKMPEQWNPTRYYAQTKAFSAWWAAAMAKRFGDRVSFFTVSPGSSMKTNAGRNMTGFKKFMFTKIMPTIAPFIGMHQPASQAAKRYIDVLHGVGGPYKNGKTYTSKPKKLVGPIAEVQYAHLNDETRAEAAFQVLGNLTGAAA
jgi:NAD(P)-dependent dehydrogenase (short-subunit alcohol dehydrogenase family)